MAALLLLSINGLWGFEVYSKHPIVKNPIYRNKGNRLLLKTSNQVVLLKTKSSKQIKHFKYENNFNPNKSIYL